MIFGYQLNRVEREILADNQKALAALREGSNRHSLFYLNKAMMSLKLLRGSAIKPKLQFLTEQNLQSYFKLQQPEASGLSLLPTQASSRFMHRSAPKVKKALPRVYSRERTPIIANRHRYGHHDLAPPRATHYPLTNRALVRVKQTKQRQIHEWTSPARLKRKKRRSLQQPPLDPAAAALRIQRWWRKEVGRSRFLEQRSAAVTIQKWVRQWQCSQLFKQIRSAAVFIQQCYRLSRQAIKPVS